MVLSEDGCMIDWERREEGCGENLNTHKHMSERDLWVKSHQPLVREASSNY